jgi:hypothetical protein
MSEGTLVKSAVLLLRLLLTGSELISSLRCHFQITQRLSLVSGNSAAGKCARSL